MSYDVITFGTAVVDLFLETPLKEVSGVIQVPVDRKIIVKKLWHATGGGGTNTAVSFSKLGLKTGFLGKVGDDESGKTILKELLLEKVDFLGSKGGETGQSVIINSEKKNRTALAYKGANDLLTFREANVSRLKTRWFYFSAMIGESLKTQLKLAELAKRKGIFLAYNSSSYLTKMGSAPIKGILKNCDALILNSGEARDLVSRGNVFKTLHSLGAKIVCVTDGENGAVVSDGGRMYKSVPNRVRLVERTGAGDAFASGFVSGLIKLRDIEKAIQIGSLNAESVIERPGAKNGLLTWPEVILKVNKKMSKVILL